MSPEYTPKENPIIIKCQGNGTLPIDALQQLQGELKKLSRENRDKLLASICEKGFIAPFFVWNDAGDFRLLDGHQRLKTLDHMRRKGWQIPELPVVYIDADNRLDVLVCRNHTKITLLEISNLRLIISGSSNLRSSQSIEQFCFQESPELFDFYRAFFTDHAGQSIIDPEVKRK